MTKSDIKKQYERQLKRVQKRIAEIEAQGLVIPKKFIPKELKKPTAKSVEKLKGITPKKLRASAITKEESEKRQRISEKRKQTIQKKQLKQWLEKSPQKYSVEPELETADIREFISTEFESWEEQRRIQDEYEKRQAEQSTEIQEGRMIYDRIVELINDPQYGIDNSNRLMRIFESAISSKGYENVMKHLASVSEDIIAHCERALRYKVGTDQWSAEIGAIQFAITGEIPSAEESAMMNGDYEQGYDYM